MKTEEEEDESESKAIMHDIQAQMFEKARNYVGHNVLLQQGKLSLQKAKTIHQFKKQFANEGKAEKAIKIDQYIASVLDNSYPARKVASEKDHFGMFNLPQSIGESSTRMEDDNRFLDESILNQSQDDMAESI